MVELQLLVISHLATRWFGVQRKLGEMSPALWNQLVQAVHLTSYISRRRSRRPALPLLESSSHARRHFQLQYQVLPQREGGATPEQSANSSNIVWVRLLCLSGFFGFLFSVLMMVLCDGEKILEFGLFQGYNALTCLVVLQQVRIFK